jgi:hypothetical protein
MAMLDSLSQTKHHLPQFVFGTGAVGDALVHSRAVFHDMVQHLPELLDCKCHRANIFAQQLPATVIVKLAVGMADKA